jgi:transposase InsO family protein
MTDGRRWGVEPICNDLKIAPSTYYDTKSRPPSARAVRDAELGPALVDLWKHNYSVYGRRKLTKAARRAGHDVGRDQVARLMRTQGIRGASRSKKRFTTKSDPGALRAPDLVNRNFTASRPDALWVTAARTINMAAWTRRHTTLDGLVCHSDAWFNEERLHSELEDLTPAEFEADYRQRSQPDVA